jgi:hypothetical protein
MRIDEELDVLAIKRYKGVTGPRRDTEETTEFGLPVHGEAGVG